MREVSFIYGYVSVATLAVAFITGCSLIEEAVEPVESEATGADFSDDDPGVVDGTRSTIDDFYDGSSEPTPLEGLAIRDGSIPAPQVYLNDIFEDIQSPLTMMMSNPDHVLQMELDGSTIGADPDEDVVDFELPRRDMMCPAVYSHALHPNELWIDFNVCGCRGEEMRGAWLLSKQDDGLGLLLPDELGSLNYHFPRRWRNQWGVACGRALETDEEEAPEPLGLHPVYGDEWLTFQSGNHAITGALFLSRTSGQEEWEAGVLVYDLTTADDEFAQYGGIGDVQERMLRITQVIEPELGPFDNYVWVLEEAAYIGLVTEATLSNVSRHDLNDDERDVRVNMTGRAEANATITIKMPTADETVPLTWDDPYVQDRIERLPQHVRELCQPVALTAPDCSAFSSGENMHATVGLSHAEVFVRSLSHRAGGPECACPNEGASIEMGASDLAISLTNPEIGVQLGGEEEIIRMYGRLSATLSTALTVDLDSRDACRSPDSFTVEVPDSQNELLQADVPLADVFCSADATMVYLCISDDAVELKPIIRTGNLTRGGARYLWDSADCDEDPDVDECDYPMDVEEGRVTQMISDALTCGNVCQVDDSDYVYPAYCDNWLLLPWGDCQDLCADDEVCNPITETCSECFDSTDCTDDDRPVCNPLGNCAECFDGEGCLDGFRCLVGECVEGCSDDEECTDVNFPACSAGHDCVECTADNTNLCDSMGWVCKYSEHTCAECTLNSHCDDGFFCESNDTCQPEESESACSSDDQCTDVDLPACNTEEGECVQCTGDTFCGGTTPYCNLDGYRRLNECVECFENSHCPGSRCRADFTCAD